MEKFVSLTSKVLPLNIRDIDTDMIIPADFLKSIDRRGFGANVFRRLRDQDPNFPMNLEKYKGSEILVADDNFACGSSREHAVWALLGAGIKVVISKSFADIFNNNSAKNGLVTIVLKSDEVDLLLKNAEEQDNYQITVSLEEQTIKLQCGTIFNFNFDPFRKHCILNGLEDFDYLISHLDEIKNYKAQRTNKFFSTENFLTTSK